MFLIMLEDGIIEVIATNGCSDLGGVHFDEVLVDFCVEAFKKQTGLDVNGNSVAKRRLRARCEKAKQILSRAHKVEI